MKILEQNNDDLKILCDFAKRTNRNIVFKEVPYPTYFGNRLTKYRTTVYISDRNKESCYFICFWDPFLKIAEYTNFSGIFFPISNSLNQAFTIRKRNILDNLNLLSGKSFDKTGLAEFDSKVVIKNFNHSPLPKLFHHSKAQYLMVQALNIKNALKIGMNLVDVGFVPALNNRSHVGIYSQQEWFLDFPQIEQLFEIGEKLRRIATNSYNNEQNNSYIT